MALLLAKAGVGALLLGALAAALLAPAPRRTPGTRELRGLLASGLVLDAAGLVSALADRGWLGLTACGLGVGLTALAGWLSRGAAGGSGPDGAEPPVVEPPVPGPDGLDWARFDRERDGWARPRERAPR